MLPCNVVVQELEGGKTEMAALDSVTSMLSVDNKEVTEVVYEIEEKLQCVIPKENLRSNSSLVRDNPGEDSIQRPVLFG